MRDRIWINADRTILVEMYEDGTVTVATRDDPGDVWGPPIELREEVNA